MPVAYSVWVLYKMHGYEVQAKNVCSFFLLKIYVAIKRFANNTLRLNTVYGRICVKFVCNFCCSFKLKSLLHEFHLQNLTDKPRLHKDQFCWFEQTCVIVQICFWPLGELLLQVNEKQQLQTCCGRCRSWWRCCFGCSCRTNNCKQTTFQ